MIRTRIITPKVIEGFVSRQTNLGIDTYALNELYSPNTELWKSKVLDLGSPKYPPQIAAAPTRYWFDRSRYNNHGAITGATWKCLPSGVWCLDFDGSDDVIDCGNATSLTEAKTALTIIAWFKQDTTGVLKYLVSCGGLVAATKGYQLYLNTSNLGAFGFDNGTTTYALGSTVTITDTTSWHFLAGGFDGATPIAFIQVDNTYKTATPSIVSSAAAQYNLRVGRNGYAGYFFDGMIGEVYIINRVLSQLELLWFRQATKWRYV